ncbi:MAG: anti-sigma factor [Acidimicrobiales bacterium]
MTGDLHDLVPLFAVDALDPDEAALVARHVEGCGPCQEELAGLRTATTALAETVAAPLPSALRDRILAEVARSPQEPAPPADPPPVSRPGDSGARVASIDAARATRDRRHRMGRWRRSTDRRLLTAAAAVAAVAALSVGALALAGVVPGDGDPGRTDAQVALADIQQSPDARTVTLAGTGGTVQVAWSTSRNQLVLLAEGLPDPGPGRVYELWRIDAGGPGAAGLFTPDPSGTAGLVAPLGGETPGAWGVTVEPAGGSEQPTPPIVYQAEA